MKKKLPRSIRKFIRLEKARIRRQILDFKQQEELISEIYNKISKQYANTRNIQVSNK